MHINSRVPDQNGVSLLYIMLEIHHSGREPSICCVFFHWRWCPTQTAPTVSVRKVRCAYVMCVFSLEMMSQTDCAGCVCEEGKMCIYAVCLFIGDDVPDRLCWLRL